MPTYTLFYYDNDRQKVIVRTKVKQHQLNNLIWAMSAIYRTNIYREMGI